MHQIIIVIFFISSPLVISAWDIAVAMKHEIQFLNSTGHIVGRMSESTAEIHALTYSPEQQLMFFSDNSLVNGSIFSFQVITDATNSVTYRDLKVVVSKQNDDVHNIAYDHKTEILYWTNTFGHQIKWLKLGSKTPQPGQVLFTFKGKAPAGIAIDSCKRYLYWTTIRYGATIERSLLDGSQPEVLVSDNLNEPLGIVLDQNSQRMYWIDDLKGSSYAIESATFDGKDRKTIINDDHHDPISLAVFQGNVFWTDKTNKAVWKLPINSNLNKPSPVAILDVDKIHPTGITSADQMLSNDLNLKCNPVVEPTMKVIKATTEIVSPATIETANELNINVSSYCLNQGLLTESMHCDCPAPYSGARCEIDLCHNYCLNGVCEVDSTGPKCKKCAEGWSGERCEIDLCHNYCVWGKCSVKDSQPICECIDGWSGERCEIWHAEKDKLKEEMDKVCQSYCRLYTTKEQQEEAQPIESCVCTNDIITDTSNSSKASDYAVSAIHEPCLWKEANQVLTLVLGFVCILLLIIVAVLTKKVLTLRKRPRYKKRIIVSKSTTPMTCRPQPEQCEITIENCCNMNICETPP